MKKSIFCKVSKQTYSRRPKSLAPNDRQIYESEQNSPVRLERVQNLRAVSPREAVAPDTYRARPATDEEVNQLLDSMPIIRWGLSLNNERQITSHIQKR